MNRVGSADENGVETKTQASTCVYACMRLSACRRVYMGASVERRDEKVQRRLNEEQQRRVTA